MLEYSWNLANSHQRMECQKNDWEGRGGEGGKRFMNAFRFFLSVWMGFSLYYLIEILFLGLFLLFFLIHILTYFL